MSIDEAITPKKRVVIEIPRLADILRRISISADAIRTAKKDVLREAMRGRRGKGLNIEAVSRLVSSSDREMVYEVWARRIRVEA